MTLTKKVATSAMALTLAAPVLADVTLYGREDYRGRSITLDRAFPDLSQSSLDDRASSLSVRNGSWQLCTESYFRGQCVVIPPGDYPSLRGTGLNNAVSSVRQVESERRVPAPVARGVVLYEGPNFSGRSVSVDRLVDGLDSYNDWARSMIVHEGNWELCEHDRFRGDCARFGPGQYPNLGPLAGDVSSLRPLDVYATAPSPLPVAPRVIAPRVVLYEGPNFRGRAIAIEDDLLANLQATGFNDRASSLRVDGGSWVMCSDANFQGQCWTFGPGEYPVLPAGLTDRVSSARRIADGEARFR